MCSSVFFSSILQLTSLFFFFFNDTATTEIYTLSLHDALPISVSRGPLHRPEHHFREEWHVPSPRILYKLRSTSLMHSSSVRTAHSACSSSINRGGDNRTEFSPAPRISRPL